MNLTDRESLAAMHGMVFGALFLLAFAGGFAGLYSLRPALLTNRGLIERSRRLVAGTWSMAIVAWLTVITGTFIVYPWYRAKGPTSAKSLITANPLTANWHTFGMEWKEHIAWLAPILATMVAIVVAYYGPRLIKHQGLRRVLMGLFVLAFASAAVAGLLGAFITKVSPVH